MKHKEALIHAIEELTPFISGMLEKSGIPGYAFSAVFADGDSLVRSGGTLQRGMQQAPDENTVFMIGSCSKSFTALTAARLAEQGRIDLDQPVEAYLPIKLTHAGVKVTLRHLLSNSSGLPNLGLSEIVTGKYLYGRIPGEYAEAYPFEKDKSITDFMQGAQDEMVGTPGGQYIYSNEGFSLAGEALAAAAGKPLPELVKELIFTPMGMKNSFYLGSEVRADMQLASGHIADGSPMPVYYEPAIAGAGGVLSTAADLGRYVQTLLCSGELERRRILTQRVLQEVEQERIVHQTAETLIGGGFGPERYGMGLMSYPDYLGLKVITHGGSTGNFSSAIFYERELGFGIAALCNGGGGEGLLELFAFMVAARALGKDPFDVFPFFALEGQYRALEGLYTSRGEAVCVRISYRQGRLWWESLDGNGNSPSGARPLTAAGDAETRRFSFLNGPGASSPVLFFPGDDGRMRVQKDRNVLTRR